MSRRPLVPAMALLAVVVAAAVIVVSRDDGDTVGGGEVQAATGAAPVPRIPAVVPAGLDPAAAVTLPAPGDDRPPSSLTLFVAPGTTDLHTRPDLGVYVTKVPAGTDLDSEGETVVVRGKEGLLLRGFGQDRAMLVVSWAERNGLYVRAASRHYPAADLVAAAGRLTFSPDGVVTDRELSDGLLRVATQVDATVPGASSVPVPLATQGHVASYTSPDDGTASAGARRAERQSGSSGASGASAGTATTVRR